MDFTRCTRLDCSIFIFLLLSVWLVQVIVWIVWTCVKYVVSFGKFELRTFLFSFNNHNDEVWISWQCIEIAQNMKFCYKMCNVTRLIMEHESCKTTKRGMLKYPCVSLVQIIHESCHNNKKYAFSQWCILYRKYEIFVLFSLIYYFKGHIMVLHLLYRR